ncbi:MAG TPA: hypothetical protein VFP22_10105 [Candidatus Limnocylindrales bacterium]|nr:hypothetical protein [Candidatus Limnocylindrales bacterium]
MSVDPALGARALPLTGLSRILVAYGIVGLLAAIAAVVFLFVGLSRVAALSDRIDELGGVSTILDRTATVLEDAAASARGFASTVDNSTTALTTAATDVRNVVPRLHELEATTNGISLLGAQPLAPLAGLFGQIAGQLDDLDTRLDTVATALTTNQASLQKNAASLTDLATEARAMATKLGGDALPTAIDDARLLLIALVVVATLGALVPALGALALGLWLRRWLVRGGGRIVPSVAPD